MMLRRRLWQPRWVLRLLLLLLLLRVVTTLHHHRTSLTAAVVMMTTMNDAHVAKFRFYVFALAAAFGENSCSERTNQSTECFQQPQFVLAETLRRCCTHLFPIFSTLSIVEAI